jgi:hypothetical protein
MSGHALDDAAIARWWHEQSAAQGLPDEVDPALIQQVAVLALAGNDGGPGTRPGRRSTVPPPHATKGPVHHATIP